MRSRLLALGVPAAICLAVSLSACTSTSSSGTSHTAASNASIPHLNVRTHAMYGTLDPATTQNCFSTYCSFIYERLLKFNNDGQPTPQLAISWTTPNPTTYLFKLRRGVKFWDGTAMTADDVAYSLNYERSPKNNSSIALKTVANVTAVNPSTVQITLTQPDAALPSQLAASGAIFEEKFQKTAGANFGKPGTLTMATGPFKVVSFNGSSDLELAANPLWWGGPVDIKKVSVQLITDDTAAALAIRSGSIDVGAGYGDPREMASALGSAGTVTKVVWGTSLKYISLNTTWGALKDVHVRRAIAYATDRAQYIAASGGGDPLYTIVLPIQLQQIASPSQISSLMQSIPTYPYNLAKAKAEMAQSKYPTGFSASIDCPPFGISECETMAGQLAKIGIKLKANSVSTLKYVNEVYHSASYPFVYGYISCTGPDPSGCLGYLLGKASLNGINSAQWDPPGSDSLIQSGVATSDNAQRFAIYSKLLSMLGTDVPYVTYELPVFSIMLSNKYVWPGSNLIKSDPIFYTPWILNIKAAG
jgi:peptide/nickel transport system substrate-binding protein